MFTLINRLAWWISIILALVLAFLISDLASSTYRSGAENFFEWGWVWGLIFIFIGKKMILSETRIHEELSKSGMMPLHVDTPINSHAQGEINGVEQESQNTTDESRSLNHTPWGMISDIENPMISEKIQDAIETDIHTEATPPEPDAPNWIVTFFSDRPLAKIGGILLFLGALFFLSLIWTAVGPVGKILIGLLFGFFLYGIGVWMDKKGHTTESRTLLGVGIAINTLTILSGRWMIGSGADMILSDTLTLIFLLLNTLFAVVTGLAYTSRTFLIFSFIFAYLIPFLIGSHSDSEILMVLYVGLISGGGYLLTRLLSARSMSRDVPWLFYTINIGSVILMTLSGFSLDTVTELLTFVIVALLLTWTGVILSAKIGDRSSLGAILISGYIMLASALFGMGDQDGILIIHILALLPFVFLTGMQLIAVGSSMILSWILLIPLIFGIFFLSIFGISSLVFIILPILGVYGIVSIFLFSYVAKLVQYLVFIGFALFLGICGVVIDFRPIEFASMERFVLALSSIVFLGLTFSTAVRYKMPNIALLGLFSSALILALILVPSWWASWIFYGVFLCIGFLFPFLVSMFGFSLPSVILIGYQVIMNLFLIGELVFLGNSIWFTASSTSLITLGLIVFALSVASLIYSFVLIRQTVGVDRISLSTLPEEKKLSVSALFAIPLSLFSLAVAITFAHNALIVSTVWIFESTLLAYFSGKTRNAHLFLGALILLMIGLLRLIPFFDTVNVRDWLALVPIMVIALSLFIGARYVYRDSGGASLYDIIHIIGMGTVGLACMEIIPHTSTGWSLLGLSIFLLISTWSYRHIKSSIIAVWILIVGALYFLTHLVRIDSLSLSFFPIVLQLFALALALFSTWYAIEHSAMGRVSFALGSIMTLLITSLYVNEITDNVFMVTIYLTLLATVFILRGINNEKPYFRTIGLYIGAIALIKILLYDLWVGVDNLIIRVLALMISGGVMIALSQLYGRRVNRPWSEEFSPQNFSGFTPLSGEKRPSQDRDEMIPFDDEIAVDLEKFDVSGISHIRLLDTTGVTLFESKRAGIIRIVYSITSSLRKTEFAPGELQKIYATLIPHIRSALPKKDLDMILSSIAGWIEQGGSVDIVQRISK